MREFNKGAVFPKNNITRNMEMMKDRIITPIPLFSFAIVKESLDQGSSLL